MSNLLQQSTLYYARGTAPIVPEFPPKLDWLNTAPIKLSKVICFESELPFSVTKVYLIALILIKFLAGSQRKSGCAGLLDLLLYKLYACTARPGVFGEKIQRYAGNPFLCFSSFEVSACLPSQFIMFQASALSDC